MSPFAVRGEGRREREDGNYGLVIVRQETKKGESERERERGRERVVLQLMVTRWLQLVVARE